MDKLIGKMFKFKLNFEKKKKYTYLESLGRVNV